MAKRDVMKWLYTFVLLLATLWWAKFCVNTVAEAMQQPTAIGVLEVAGVSSMLGVLLTLNVNVNQHWFRKKTPAE